MNDEKIMFKATHKFEEIVQALKSSLTLKTNRHNLTPIQNSFLGKEAIKCLNELLPKLYPDKKELKVKNLLQFMVESKVIHAPYRKTELFKDNWIYVFSEDSEIKEQPKKRSRRSASFSGIRRGSQNIQRSPKPSSPTFYIENNPKHAKMTRRLSRSNGLLEKIKNIGDTENDDQYGSRGLENEGFDEGIVDKNEQSDDIYAEKKEKAYDWLPFFKTKRFQAKQQMEANQKKTARRSISLDRNHIAASMTPYQQPQPSTPPRFVESSKEMVLLQPSGMKLTSSISRTRMYESIARRDKGPIMTQQHQQQSAIPQRISRSRQSRPISQNIPMTRTIRDVMIWKRELIKRLTELIGESPSSEWCHRIDTLDVQWNTNLENIDRIDFVVKSKICGQQPDYPQSVIQFMDFLGRFPFSKKTDRLSDENVVKIFGTLVNRLEDLDSPIYPEEASFFVSILSKMEIFGDMMSSTNRMMKWTTPMNRQSITSSEESDGFTRELPICGIRASMHRRRNVSPAKFLDTVSNINIQDESSYKIMEPWMIEACQLFLIALPTARRRKLHKFVLFMRSIATNEVLDLTDHENHLKTNREAVINGLWTGVCGGIQKNEGMMITAVLLANHRTLFSIPDYFCDRVIQANNMEEEKASMYAKINREKKDQNDKKIMKNGNNGKKEEKKQSLLDRLLKR